MTKCYTFTSLVYSDCSLWTWERVRWLQTAATPAYRWGAVTSVTAPQPASGPRPAVSPPWTPQKATPPPHQPPGMQLRITGKVRTKLGSLQNPHPSRLLIYQNSPHSRCPKRMILLISCQLGVEKCPIWLITAYCKFPLKMQNVSMKVV